MGHPLSSTAMTAQYIFVLVVYYILLIHAQDMFVEKHQYMQEVPEQISIDQFYFANGVKTTAFELGLIHLIDKCEASEEKISIGEDGSVAFQLQPMLSAVAIDFVAGQAVQLVIEIDDVPFHHSVKPGHQSFVGFVDPIGIASVTVFVAKGDVQISSVSGSSIQSMFHTFKGSLHKRQALMGFTGAPTGPTGATGGTGATGRTGS